MHKAIQKTAEATGGLTGDKVANKITSASKFSKKLYSKNENELEIAKERYILSEQILQIQYIGNTLNQPSKFRKKIRSK